MFPSLPVLNSADLQTERDPVCGMSVDPLQAAAHLQHAGVDYYFCCAACQEKFRKDPARYLNSTDSQEHACCSEHAPSTPVQPSSSAKYFCPMCPGVESDQPGDCPVCGMALEKNIFASDADDADGDLEIKSMQRRLTASAIMAVPVFLLAMGHLIPFASVQHWTDSEWSRWLQLMLSTLCVWGAGWPLMVRGWRSLVTGNLNMFTLIAIGVCSAYVFSLTAMLLPGLFPHDLQHGGKVPIYFESAAMIVVLVLLGQVLEMRARHKTGSALRSLMQLAPPTARRVTNSGEETVPVELIAVNDLLRIIPGDKIPVDGLVVEGESTLDESMLTGEAMPVDKASGDTLTAGTLNGNGTLVMRAVRVGRDTLLSQIVRLVAESQRSRAPIQSIADRVSSWFVPAVLGVALLTFIVWLLVGPEPRLAFALVNAIAVLIIACPCALGLATPMSIMVAVGRGAQEGVLIKNAEALERLERVNTLVLDKTGTITLGKPKVTDVIADGDIGQDQLLMTAAALEATSEHPLARAIVHAANARNLKLTPVSGFRATTGFGVVGKLEQQTIVIGNREHMQHHSIVLPSAFCNQAVALQRVGKTVVYIANEQRLLGMIAVADTVKPTSAAAIEQLRGLGITIHLLTGDNQLTAAAVADQLKIEHWQADVRPDDKAKYIQSLTSQGLRVAMAGDGTNDAPALAAADVGIAMGTGTDVANHSAGLTLVQGDLQGIVRAIALSHDMMRNIRQNLFFAFVYNLVGVPIAAGVLYPVFGMLLSPILAGVAMSLSSVSVIANSLRIRNRK